MKHIQKKKNKSKKKWFFLHFYTGIVKKDLIEKKLVHAM